jgi:hypothetical protein
MDECSLKTNTQVTYIQRIPNLMKISIVARKTIATNSRGKPS